ncbi:MAG: glycoside hydrolase family 28 protein [Verrucomicrobiota bacterium]
MNTANVRRQFLARLAGLGGAAVALSPGASSAAVALTGNALNVRDCGAGGDGARPDTKALQEAIDRCGRAGGGTVYFPAGRYLTGTLFLKSGVALYLDAGAVLLGSLNLQDYPTAIPAIRSYTDNYTEKSLLYAENEEQISLQGHGVIDGQGAAFKGPYKVRPYLIRLIACRDVSVQDITLRNSPMWVQHFLACDGVRIEGITVRSRCNHNNDGIDIDGCQRVRISNCDISSGDDAIVLKSTLNRPCKDVAITNCVLSSACNAFKLGTESNGGFENIVLSNCALYDTHLAGIALELVDGGSLDGVTISNVSMHNVNGPIFIRLGNRARPHQEGTARPGLGTLRRINISGLQAVGADRIGCSITGLPGQPAEDIALENIRISFAGGGPVEAAPRAVPEHPDKYPEYSMFGPLPAYGFYCRHVRGLRFSNMRLDVAASEARPALVCEDVENLDVFGWNSAVAAAPVLRFNEVRNAFLHGCRGPQHAAAFLRIDGKSSERIKLLANDLVDTQKAVELGEGVSEKAVAAGL